MGGGRAIGYVVGAHDLAVGTRPARTGTGTTPAALVLVVSTLDPRLAGVLDQLAGLVSETGGALSHLAILAREQGVPTVVGVPDDDLGEAVKAIIRVAPASTVGDAELAAFVAEALAAFKVPSHWERSITPLPRNATGKLLKNLLRGVGDVAFDEVL